MDEVTITKGYLDSANVDVAIAGSGPARMATAKYLAKKRIKNINF